MLDLVKSAAVVVCKDRVWKQAKHKGVKQWEYLKNIPRFILNYPNRMTSSAATQLFCSPNPASSTLFSLLTHWALSCSCSLRFILAHSGKKSHFSLFCWGCMATGFTINESTGFLFVSLNQTVYCGWQSKTRNYRKEACLIEQWRDSRFCTVAKFVLSTRIRLIFT